jgi:hypothetical protein
MSQSKVILASVLLSVLCSAGVTVAIVSAVKNTDPSEQFVSNSIGDASAVLEGDSEVNMDPLEAEFLALIARNQELSSELTKYEFSDPQHAVLLQELDIVNIKISENITQRKSKQ